MPIEEAKRPAAFGVLFGSVSLEKRARFNAGSRKGCGLDASVIFVKD